MEARKISYDVSRGQKAGFVFYAETTGQRALASK
jgi:hypothetical protein